MGFQRSPYHSYWAAKLMEDIFIPLTSATNVDKCNFVMQTNDVYVSEPYESLRRIFECLKYKLNNDTTGNYINKDGYNLLIKVTNHDDYCRDKEICETTVSINPTNINKTEILRLKWKTAKENNINFKVILIIYNRYMGDLIHIMEMVSIIKYKSTFYKYIVHMVIIILLQVMKN